MCEPREFFQDGYMSNTRTFEAKKGEFIAIHVRRKPNGKLRVTIDYGPDKGLLACEDFLDIFDIVNHLSASGATKADDSTNLILLNKSNVVNRVCFWCQRNHAQLHV